VEGIHAADLVIADVTGTNANVMYELGAAHALRKATVMMSQSIGNLPFDLRSYLVQAYDPDGPQTHAFVERLREIGEKHAAGLLRFGNPFTDFAPSEFPREARPRAEPGTTLGEGYGYLDYSADMEEYGDQVLAQFARLDELSSKLAADVRALNPAINRARSSGSSKLERQLMNDLASMMTAYAKGVLQEVVPAFHEGWERLGFAMHWMASQKPADTDPAKIAALCASGTGLRQALQGIIANIDGVREIVATGRGRTGALDKGIVAMDQAFNAVVSEVMIADAILNAVYTRVGCAERSSG
jgi:hypothetical protein